MSNADVRIVQCLLAYIAVIIFTIIISFYIILIAIGGPNLTFYL
jgi:hypothetical protein